MNQLNQIAVYPMFYYKTGEKTNFSMNGKTFYLTDDEIYIMQKNGLSKDNIISYAFELLINKKLADFSELVLLFENRFN
jgi:hypothetical protein